MKSDDMTVMQTFFLRFGLMAMTNERLELGMWNLVLRWAHTYLYTMYKSFVCATAAACVTTELTSDISECALASVICVWCYPLMMEAQSDSETLATVSLHSWLLEKILLHFVTVKASNVMIGVCYNDLWEEGARQPESDRFTIPCWWSSDPLLKSITVGTVRITNGMIYGKTLS